MNQVIITGRLTKDIDIRYTTSQVAVAVFTLAVKGYGDKTDFVQCKTFDKNAERMERYVGKGCRVLIRGRVSPNNYEKDGVKVFTNDIIADNVEYIDFKNSGREELQEQLPEEFSQLAEDVPF